MEQKVFVWECDDLMHLLVQHDEIDDDDYDYDKADDDGDADHDHHIFHLSVGFLQDFSPLIPSKATCNDISFFLPR